MARKGHDIFATAQTGTGKTAAFSLPMIQRLLDSDHSASRKTARALILAPTRELAEQIADNIKAYTKYTDLSVVAVFGGRKMSSQVSALENGVDILVATPGRLEEHIEQGNVSVANLEFLVFDDFHSSQHQCCNRFLHLFICERGLCAICECSSV